MAEPANHGETELLRPREDAALAALVRSAMRMPEPVFAVLDGGQFDDLPAALAGRGLSARSLLLGHGELDVERFGPWLVTVRDGQQVSTVAHLVGDTPAAVFWSSTCLRISA